MIWNGHATLTTSQREATICWDSSDETFVGVQRNSIKSKAYTTLVQPTLEYTSPVWDPHERTNINKLEKVQQSAATVVFDKPHRRTADNQESVTALISDLGWPSLEERRGNAWLAFMYKLLHGLLCIPTTYHPKEVSSHTWSGCRRTEFKLNSPGEPNYVR